MNNDLAIIILAAGMGKRMGSPLPKVLSKAGEHSLIEHVLITADKLNPLHEIVVIGHKGELVKEAVLAGAKNNLYSDKVEFALQKERLGTGDAVKSALPILEDFIGTVLILSGDVPLIKAETLNTLLKTHNEQNATVTVLSMRVREENAYGRIVRDKDGYVSKIVEFKDCTDDEKNISEVNAGIYAVDSAFLKPALESLTNNNAQQEYYLTDIIEKAVKEGQIVAASLHEDPSEFLGVNTPSDLEKIINELKKRA